MLISFLYGFANINWSLSSWLPLRSGICRKKCIARPSCAPPQHNRIAGGSIILAMLFALAASPAWATFSIVACDSGRNCGAAVATNNLAVGATVIYAQAGVGAVASQFETNPSCGPQGLGLLATGQSADSALRELLGTDDGFEGQDVSFRQVGVVGPRGDGAAFSGAEALSSGWFGELTGPGYSIQGNGLTGPEVLEAMRFRFLAAEGSLAERLISALEAGEAAGG